MGTILAIAGGILLAHFILRFLGHILLIGAAIVALLLALGVGATLFVHFGAATPFVILLAVGFVWMVVDIVRGTRQRG